MGRGLEQYDGYCIAHADPHLTRAWRAKGGKNSSTAARQDKRIPEHYKVLLDELTEGLSAVRAGTMAPAAYNAMCRGISTYLNVRRRAEEDMDLIRAEEAQIAAQEVVGVHGDIEILTAAAAINDRRNEYRQRGLADQGLATLKESSDPNQPPEAVLTAEGKRRFGERRMTGYLQENIDEIRNAARTFQYDKEELPDVLEELAYMSESYEATLADLDHKPDLPKDPFTGQPLSDLPPGVHRDTLSDLPGLHDDRTPEILTDQYNQVEALYREVEELDQDEHFNLKKDLYMQGKDLDTVTITTNRPLPNIDHSQVPTNRY